MAATSVGSTPFELPEPLSKLRPFETLCIHGNHEGRREHELESHLGKQKEGCFRSPHAVQRKFKNLVPHILALQRFKSYMETFLLMKAQEFDSYSNWESADKDDEIQPCISTVSPPVVIREIFFNAGKFQSMQALEHQSFILDIMLHVLCSSETQQQDEVEVEYKNAIAVAQLWIRDFRKELSQTEDIDETTEEEIAIIQSSHASAMDNVKEMGTKVNVRMQQYLTEENWVCHAVGLEIDFLHRYGFDQLPEHIKDHLSIEQWLYKFLEENYKRESELPENASLTDKELLERIGFRADGDAVNTLLERASSLKEHLQPFDWVEMYIMDELKYNPLLSGIGPRFPFLHTIREEWLILPMEEGDDPPSYREVNVINLESRNSRSYTKQDGCSCFPLSLEDETHKVLFHGTDHNSARDIFIHGAMITHGRKNRDFSSGSGFYLTDNFEHSVEWAFCSTSKPAVLVYRVNRSLLEAMSGYSLIGEEKRSEWTDLVRQYRSGKPTKKLREFARDYDFIEGPRTSTCDEVQPEPNHGTYQMCVISDELSEALDGSLHSAVFYGGN